MVDGARPTLPEAQEEAVSAKVTRKTLDVALDAARRAIGNTSFVLVSAQEAERLWLALRIADGMAGLAVGENGIVEHYAELSK